MSRSGTPGRALVVEADGGSRGNPGVAGYGAVVRDASTGSLLVELAEPLGQASNNVAEYSGLLAGLKAAADLDPAAQVRVRLDSKLVVEQMSGRWKIKHEDMRRLALEARDVCRAIESAGGSVQFEWVPRAQNKAADALSNDAMDGKTVRRLHGPGAEPAPAPSAGDAPRQDLRLLLVQIPSGDEVVERIAEAARPLVDRETRVLCAPDVTAVAAAAAIAQVAGVEPETSDAWAADPGRAGSEPADGASSAAYGHLRETGGTVVVVTTRRGIVTVLAEVLGLAPDRFWSIATAPGSLTAVEVWADGTASVAFTNRTDHLA